MPKRPVGFEASRELPVLWSITKGSFLNKVIILPLAFLLESLAPWAIEPVLILGGVYLAFEGGRESGAHMAFRIPRATNRPNVPTSAPGSGLLFWWTSFCPWRL